MALDKLSCMCFVLLYLAYCSHASHFSVYVSGLAQEIYRSRDEFIPHYWDVGWRAEDYQNMMTPTPAEKEKAKAEQQQTAFEQSEELIDLLERWEEPDRARQEQVNTFRRFCCLRVFESGKSKKPVWKPAHITYAYRKRVSP